MWIIAAIVVLVLIVLVLGPSMLGSSISQAEEPFDDE